MVASGALAFDGLGWWWERPLVRFGLVKPELFTVVLKTLTRQPRKGNLRWWKPWDCVALIKDGAVNKVAFPDKRSPLHRLEKRVGGGGGGVSGKPAQRFNWEAVDKLAEQGVLPVIGPSIMQYEDIGKMRRLGAKAYSFGAIHLPSYPIWLKPWTIFTNPCKPTQFVERKGTTTYEN